LEYYGSIKSNEITFTRLAKDTLIEVESYKIADYKTSSAPYEGHYIHRDTKLVSKTGFRQRGIRYRDKRVKYLLETLEPKESILFNWNFSIRCYKQKVTQAMF
jgi:hypothetical protein